MKANLFPEGIKFLFALYFLILIFVFHAWGQGTWTQKGNFPMMSRESAVAFELNGRGYFGTGLNVLYFNDLWKFEPIADVWTQMADIPSTTRTNSFGVSVNGKGYVGLGNSYFNGNFFNLNDLWEFDPLMNQWTQKQNFPGIARQHAVAVQIGTKIYTGLGDSSSVKYYDWWEYNPFNNSWIQKSSFPGVTNYEDNAFSSGLFGYVITKDSINHRGFLWAYNSSTDTWFQKLFIPDTTKGRRSAVTFTIGSVAYYGTGYGMPDYPGPCTDYKNDFWQYNPIADQWVQVDSIPVRRDRACAISINGNGYVFGGFNPCSNPQYLNDVWEYTPDTNVFAGVENSDTKLNISISPNPFSDRIIVDGIESTGFNCSLFDLKGSKVSVDRSGKSIQTKDVKPGIYFLKISYKEKEYFFKVMKKSKD